MAFEARKLVFFGVAGVLLAGLIIAAVVVAPVTAKTGILIVKVTDKPPLRQNLQKLLVTIDQLAAHRKGAGITGDTWVTLQFKEGVTQVEIDLLELENIVKDLSITEIPEGNYTMLKMRVVSATAVYSSGEVSLKVPGEHLMMPIHFRIKPGKATTVLLDINYDKAVVSKANILKPVVKATVLSEPQ
jgi:hypothetical protein